MPKSVATCLRDSLLVDAIRTAPARNSKVGFGVTFFLLSGKIPSQRSGRIQRQAQMFSQTTQRPVKQNHFTAMNALTENTSLDCVNKVAE